MSESGHILIRISLIKILLLVSQDWYYMSVFFFFFEEDFKYVVKDELHNNKLTDVSGNILLKCSTELRYSYNVIIYYYIF